MALTIQQENLVPNPNPYEVLATKPENEASGEATECPLSSPMLISATPLQLPNPFESVKRLKTNNAGRKRVHSDERDTQQTQFSTASGKFSFRQPDFRSSQHPLPQFQTLKVAIQHAQNTLIAAAT